jgi:tRNA (guanine26-N2/guanine27-N2)-dimethyltransferase
MIKEHSVSLDLKLPKRDVHAKMEVFYNPVMASNRNISILVLNALAKKDLKIVLPLAGSGVRALRFAEELKKGKVKQIYVNDKKEGFVKKFEKSLKLNQLSRSKFSIHSEDANLFLLTKEGFDYIDIDPFGSPNPFLAAAIQAISRAGVLAITATDTAALTGTYAKVTRRKYFAHSLKNYMMHETGLRILIRKVQLQGIQFDKALVPVLSYHKDHYFRIYFISTKGKEKCDEIIKEHKYLLFCSKCLEHKVFVYNNGECSCGASFLFAGPLWAGKLFDTKLVSKMRKLNEFAEEKKFLDLLYLESKKDVVGFYDIHAIAKSYKLEPVKMQKVLKSVAGSRTHFSVTGVKTRKKLGEVVGLFRK